MNNDELVDSRIRQLASGFDEYLRTYDEVVPPAKSVHFSYHVEAIRTRRSLGSTAAAIDDERFLGLVRETLLAWGVGVRGQRLVSEDDFRRTFMDKRDEIASLDGLCIDDPSLDLDMVVSQVWKIVSGLKVVEDGPILAPCSKALHHLLPDLVAPIDRFHTRVFFQYRKNKFERDQRRFFEGAYRALARLARETSPSRYVGDGWRTSRTKVLDNAIAAYCKVHQLWFY